MFIEIVELQKKGGGAPVTGGRKQKGARGRIKVDGMEEFNPQNNIRISGGSERQVREKKTE